MLNVYCAEIKKIRHDKMAITGFVILILLPIAMIIKGFTVDKCCISAYEWLMQLNLVITIVLPVVSGFVITRLIQSEYQNGTIKNVLTVPVKRSSFVTGKAAVWFTWYIFSVIFVIIFSLIGLVTLYPYAFLVFAKIFTLNMLKTAIFLFAAYMPVMWVAFLQKGTFYPAIIVTMLFAVLQLAGTQIGTELLRLASCIPWTAVALLGIMGTSNAYYGVCVISVFACFIVGLEISVFNFSRQEF